jgi:CRISPR-associated protein Cmr3
MAEHRFIEPLDVLYLRGNRLFGDPGSHGEALMPPWPSLAAGALRSRMLVDQGVDPAGFAEGKAALPETLASCLGTVEHPGNFRVSFFALARRSGKEVEPLLPAPADLVIRGESVDALNPVELPASIRTSFGLRSTPVLRAAGAGKTEEPMWLGREALACYLAGSGLRRDHLVPARDIWKTDLRLGIALDGPRRTALEGHLYTADAVAFRVGHGFVLRVEGADDLVPRKGMLRFGGDGRAAELSDCAFQVPEPPWQEIQRDRRFRLVLVAPGIFPDGWLPAGTMEPVERGLWELSGIRARLVSACVPRARAVSGWDLAREQPKPAVRAVPVGSVYWFDAMEGSVDGLRRLAQEGLWGPAWTDAARRAEGFNAVLVAAWPRRDKEV